MKNALFYYYGLSVDRVVKKDDCYQFNVDNFNYKLILWNKPLNYIEELVIINKILVNTNFYFIVINNNNSALSLINGHYYVLLKREKSSSFSLNQFYFPYYYPNQNNFKVLNHSDWGSLWSNKIDYFEYQKQYIKIKYPLLFKSLDYFIGLSENAISYFYAVNKYLNKRSDDVVVLARKRINSLDFDFFNPLNIVIDNKSRDSAGYLKYLFLTNNYSYDFIDEFLINLNYSSYQYGLLLARLLFPSFYFDLYEKIVNSYVKEKEIISILNRMDDYEGFLKYVYQFINKKTSIIKIDWLD